MNNKVVTSGVSAARGNEAIAIQLGKLAGQDETVNSDAVEFLKAKTTDKRGPLWFMLDLEAIEGFDFSKCPHPHSKDGTNHPAGPAKFTVKAKTDSGTKDVTVDWYSSFVSQLPVGADLQHKLEQVALAVKKGETKAEAPYATMSTVDLTAERKDLNAAFNALKGLAKRSIHLYYQLAGCNELPGVTAEYRKDKEGAVISTAYPIKVYDKADPTDFNVLSIGAFLGLDPSEAANNGGTKEALMNTAGRDTSEDGGEEDEGNYIVHNPDEYLEMASEMAEAMDDAKFIGNLYAKLNAKDADEAILDVFKLAAHLERVTSKPGLQAKFKEISERLSDKAA